MKHKIQYSSIRLIVADMDGTLLNNQKELDEGIRDVLVQLKEKNILFTLATGRNVQIMKQYIEALDIEIPYIVNNGACIYQEDECLYEQTMDEINLYKALNIYEKEHISFIAYTSQVVYIHGNEATLHHFLQRLKGKTKLCYENKCSIIAKQAIFKVVAINEDSEHMSHIQTLINNTCDQLRCLRSEDHIYTITHKNATKGQALQRMIKNLDIAFEEVLAFGDNFNDVSMFEVAGIAVAMGNSQTAIKENADRIAQGNNEQGVSRFIKEHILDM